MSKLKLSDWASVAEIVAAVAVAVSLLFVGLELQHNTAASESATREAINQKDIEFLSLYVDPAVLAVANAKAQNGETLSTLEESQLVAAEYVNFTFLSTLTINTAKACWEPRNGLGTKTLSGSIGGTGRTRTPCGRSMVRPFHPIS
jgi:hypothetical protein